jgi:hypothetical protein
MGRWPRSRSDCKRRPASGPWQKYNEAPTPKGPRLRTVFPCRSLSLGKQRSKTTGVYVPVRSRSPARAWASTTVSAPRDVPLERKSTREEPGAASRRLPMRLRSSERCCAPGADAPRNPNVLFTVRQEGRRGVGGGEAEAVGAWAEFTPTWASQARKPGPARAGVPAASG